MGRYDHYEWISIETEEDWEESADRLPLKVRYNAYNFIATLNDEPFIEYPTDPEEIKRIEDEYEKDKEGRR